MLVRSISLVMVASLPSSKALLTKLEAIWSSSRTASRPFPGKMMITMRAYEDREKERLDII